MLQIIRGQGQPVHFDFGDNINYRVIEGGRDAVGTPHLGDVAVDHGHLGATGMLQVLEHACLGRERQLVHVVKQLLAGIILLLVVQERQSGENPLTKVAMV